MNALRTILAKLTRPIQFLLSAPLRLLSAPQYLWGMSLPTRIALVVFVCLLLASVALFYWAHPGGYKIFGPDGVWLLTIIGLVIAIPLAVRHVIKLWLEGPPSQFPDIDKAWQIGMDELDSRGLNIFEIPVFLVHGLSDPKKFAALFRASRHRFSIFSVPPGNSPIHWYASPEAIYLVLTDVSLVGKLVQAAEQPDAPKSKQSMRDLLSQTLRVMDLEQVEMEGGRSGNAPSSTIVPGQEPRKTSSTDEPSGGAVDYSSTIVPDGSLGGQQAAGGAKPIRLDRTSRTKTAARLRHVCRLLNRTRQPLAPANGVLSLLPIEVVSGEHASKDEVAQALQEDLDLLHRELRIRCPAITLVTGMEHEIGFRELVRRVGPEKARATRFGKGSTLGVPPEADHVEGVAANACASFEIWAYSMFREDGGLTAFGNPKLFALLCHVRTELRENLQDILAYAYGRQSANEVEYSRSAEDALLFAGCYFAATGEEEDLQAFVSGIFGRLHDQEREVLQDTLEWTRSASREESFYQTVANVGYLVDGVLLVVAVGLLLRLIGLLDTPSS